MLTPKVLEHVRYAMGAHSEGATACSASSLITPFLYPTCASGCAAHAEGYGTQASCHYSHAEGAFTAACNLAAHAEGFCTLACGVASHAENGPGPSSTAPTSATGTGSHAEGCGTCATGYGSHAEGACVGSIRTCAMGTGSHAEGCGSQALGHYSHVEGCCVMACGDFSHAEGFCTYIQPGGVASHAEEDRNIILGVSAGLPYQNINNGVFNCCNQKCNSGIWWPFGTLAVLPIVPPYERATCGCLCCSASSGGVYTAVQCFCINSTGDCACASTSTVPNNLCIIGSTTPTTLFPIYFNYNNDNNTHGFCLPIACSGTTYARVGLNYTQPVCNLGSHVHGCCNLIGTNCNFAHVEGLCNKTPLDTTINSLAVHVGGCCNAISCGGVANHITGNSHCSQAGVFATHISGVANCPGCLTYAAHIEGTCHRSNVGSPSWGYHAEGYLNNNNGSVASGIFTYNTWFNATGSHTEGFCNTTCGPGTHAEGVCNKAYCCASHAEGYCTTACGDAGHAEGLKTCIGNLALAAVSHVEGVATYVNSNYGHAEGVYSVVCTCGCSHAEGFCGISTGGVSHAEGFCTYANNPYAHAEGFCTTSSGNASHTEGWCSCACCNYSHAEGFCTLAYGYAAHAEGICSKVCGCAAHAEGFYTITNAIAAHAEGRLTEACGDASHAEGFCAKAYGIASHAEGFCSRATNSVDYGHAEGYGTCVMLGAGHAEGLFACSRQPSQHAAANGCLATIGDAQYNRLVLWNRTISVDPAIFKIGSSVSSISIPAKSTVMFTIRASAIDALYRIGGWYFIGAVINTSGTVRFIAGSDTPVETWGDLIADGFTVTLSTGSNIINITGNSANANTTNWTAVVEWSEVTAA